MAKKKERMLIPLNLQFFAGSGEGASTATTATTSGTEPTATQAATEPATNSTEPATQAKDNPASTPLTTEAIEKIIQSRVDKASAELGKTIAELKKENATLKKDKMTAEQVKEFEANEKEKALAEKEKEIASRENRWFAMNAIKEIGLDDGSKLSLDLVDFVMADNEEEITKKVKTFNDLVQNFVSARVDEKFKAIGRTPNGATAASTDPAKKESVAEQLGKRKAEQMKKSNDVLDKYLSKRR